MNTVQKISVLVCMAALNYGAQLNAASTEVAKKTACYLRQIVIPYAGTRDWKTLVDSPKSGLIRPLGHHGVQSIGFSSRENCPRKKAQEDAIIFAHKEGKTFCGVADGHGGSAAALFAQRNLYKFIFEALKDEKAPSKRAALQNALLQADAYLYRYSDYFGALRCGAVVTAVVMDGPTLYVINAGDSRTLVGLKKEFTARSLHGIAGESGSFVYTKDHKYTADEEWPRIERAKGFQGYEGRVNGILDPTRGLGDFGVKKGLAWSGNSMDGYYQIFDVKPRFDGEGIITALPDIMQGPLERVQFVVCGSDGLWDVLTEEGVDSFVRQHIAAGQSAPDIAWALTSSAIICGSTDDITAVVITFE